MRRPTPTADALPIGAPLEVLQAHVEWRRQGTSINALARRAGYDPDTVRRVLRGQCLKPVIVRDVREALGMAPQPPQDARKAERGVRVGGG